jgi:hypothetical protein
MFARPFFAAFDDDGNLAALDYQTAFMMLYCSASWQHLWLAMNSCDDCDE